MQWIQWLSKPQHGNNRNHAFKEACSGGHLQVAQELLNALPTIDVSYSDDFAFRSACKNGHLEVTQWLLSVKPDINIYAYEYAFLNVSNGDKYLKMLEWLITVIKQQKQLST